MNNLWVVLVPKINCTLLANEKTDNNYNTVKQVQPYMYKECMVSITKENSHKMVQKNS